MHPENNYEAPRTDPPIESPQPPEAKEDNFSRIFRFAIAINLGLLLVASLLQDEGRLFQGALGMSLTFWIAFLIMYIVDRVLKGHPDDDQATQGT